MLFLLRSSVFGLRTSDSAGKKVTGFIKLTIIKPFICILSLAVLILTGCLKTEGVLKLKGKVTDEKTDVPIPGRDIIVQALIDSSDYLVPVDAGQFSTDSSGDFTFTLEKVKDAWYYNFSIVGDSDYAFMKRTLGLGEIRQNAHYLFFTLKRLVDVTIKICRKSKTPYTDTLYLSWESDGIDGRLIYPYKIESYGKTDNYLGPASNQKPYWIGGTVNSVVRTRVFADKKTKIYWDLARNRKRKEITDTITCRRDIVNNVNFTY